MQTSSKNRYFLAVFLTGYAALLYTPLNAAEASPHRIIKCSTAALRCAFTDTWQQILDLQKAAADHAARGNTSQAVENCKQIILLDPNAPTALDAQKQIVTLYLHANQEDKAIPALTELKQKYTSQPEYVKKAHELGWDFVQKGNYATGLQIYRELQSQFSNHPRAAWFQRSIIQTYLEWGDMANAAAETEKLKTDFVSHPDYVNQMMTTADRLRSKKQFLTAAGIYETLLLQQPNSDNAVVWKRMQIANELDLEQSEKAKSEVEILFSTYKDKPQFVKQAHELGWDFVRRRDFNTALKIYTDLQAQFPDHPRAAWFQRSIAQTYFEQGDTKNALRAAEQLRTHFQSHPDYVNQMEKLVGLLVDKGQPAAARGVCDTLVEKFPNHSRMPWFLQAKARSEVWMNEPNMADSTVGLMQQRYGSDPNFADAMSWTAYEYRRAGYYERAIELYESLLSRNPGLKVQVRSIASIAQAYARLGEETKAQEKVEQLLSQYRAGQPDGVAFYVFGVGEEYYLMAEKAAGDGNPNQVSACYQNALAVWQRFEQAVPNHNSPQYTYFSGIVCQRQRQYEQAVVYFQRVVEKWPGYEHAWRARYLTAECVDSLAKAGKMDAAQADALKRTVYREILQRNPDCPVANMIRLQLNAAAQ